jgi:hypothetical protein
MEIPAEIEESVANTSSHLVVTVRADLLSTRCNGTRIFLQAGRRLDEEREKMGRHGK